MKEAARVIARHPDDSIRFQYSSYVAVRTRMNEARVLREIEGAIPDTGRAVSNNRSYATPAPRIRRLDRSERDLLRHLMAGTASREEVSPDLFESDDAYRLATALRAVGRHVEPGKPIPLSGIEDLPLAAMARRLALLEDPLLPLADVLTHLEARFATRRKAELRLQLESLDPDSDWEGYSQARQELIRLTERSAIRRGGDRSTPGARAPARFRDHGGTPARTRGGGRPRISLRPGGRQRPQERGDRRGRGVERLRQPGQ